MKSCIKRCSDNEYVWYSFYFIAVRALDILWKGGSVCNGKGTCFGKESNERETDHRFWRNFNEYR